MCAERLDDDTVQAEVGSLLEFVEDLPAGLAGEIVVGDGGGHHGVVFVEDNRICWAAARGLGRRLVDLLHERAGLSASATVTESIFRTSKANGTPFGEALHQAGLISSEGLRDALCRHTAESILTMAHGAHRRLWSARNGGGYSPRFTFATGEVLAQIEGARCPDIADEADAYLRRITGPGDGALAFRREAGLGAPVPIVSVGEHDLTSKSAVDLGRWAFSELDMAEALSAAGSSATPASVIAMSEGRRDRPCMVAWADGHLVFVVRTTELGLGRLLRRRGTEP